MSEIARLKIFRNLFQNHQVSLGALRLGLFIGPAEMSKTRLKREDPKGRKRGIGGRIEKRVQEIRHGGKPRK